MHNNWATSVGSGPIPRNTSERLWHMLGDCPLRAEAAGCSSTDSQPSLAAGSFVRGPLELLCARLGSPLHGEICEQGTVALELRVLPYTPSCFFRSLEARSPT